jgi:predicted PurR-regulated permease PerM
MVKFPAYFKITTILLGLLLFFYILFLGRSILVPLTFALIVAILLNPLVNFMHAHGVGRVLSITLSVLLFMLLVGGIFFFIGAQVARFREALPELTAKFETLSASVISWVCEKFDLSEEKVNEWINNKKSEGLKDADGIVGNTLVTISGIAITVLLVPIYIFLYLFYKPLLLDFVGKVFSSDKHGTLSEILGNTRTMVQSYLLGLLIEMVIIATLNSTVLLIIGVDYAIVLGVVGALLNLIPYIGGLISISIAMLMALLTGTPMMAFYVMLGYLAIQLLDNNFLVPVIVASKVKVNALVSIVVVLFWGALWGVAGMFLSIPLTAIFKVIFDKVKPLKPYGLLLGDTMPPIGKRIFRIHSFSRAPRKVAGTGAKTSA